MILLSVSYLALPGLFTGSTSTSTSQTTTSSSSSFDTSSSATTTSTKTSTSTSTKTTESTPLPLTGWLSYHNGNTRDGYNGSLYSIKSPAVEWNTPVDGAVYAEPLYAAGSVFIATENDSVYSLNSTNGAIQWHDQLGLPEDSATQPYACSLGHQLIYPIIGITGTPAIDPVSKIIYLAALINGTGYKLFGLNITNGQVMNSTLINPPNFYPSVEEQRGALAVANGAVYVPFGGFDLICPNGIEPHGLIWGASLTNSSQYLYNVPANPEGDFWTPQGISVDNSGYLYVVSGDSNTSSTTYGNAVIRLTPQLQNTSFFQAADNLFTNMNDVDLGSTGATLLPNNLLFVIGKDGIGYLLNASNLGGVGGELFSADICGSNGAWGSTSYANGIIYVPCGVCPTPPCPSGAYEGIHALSLNFGSNPSFSNLWNSSNTYFAGPPIIAAGAVWSFDIYSATLYAFGPSSGSVLYQLSPYISPNQLPHFTTPSFGGGMVLFAENESVYALNPSA